MSTRITVVGVIVLAAMVVAGAAEAQKAPGRGGVEADRLLLVNPGNSDVWNHYAVCRFLGQQRVPPSFRPHWAGDWEVAQSLVVHQDAELTAVELYLCRGSKVADWEKNRFKPGEYEKFESVTHGGATGVLLTILADAGGKPGAALSASVTVGPESIRPDGGFVRASFPAAVPIKKGKTYWIHLKKPSEDAPTEGNTMYGVPASLKDDSGPRDWYREGKAAERTLPFAATGDVDWHVMKSHDFFFRVYGKAAGARKRWGETPVLGNYPVQLYEPTKPGEPNRLDAEAMIRQLKGQGSNVYYYLISHNPETDWEDLQLFLPKALEAGIEVWAYLVPPSETPFNDSSMNYSEPFRLDYRRWARELAMLSLNYPNLRGWVIDDFANNTWLYTPSYVQKMREQSKTVNDEFLFYPLMYFPEITPAFVDSYGKLIDGVVAAYPQRMPQSGIKGVDEQYILNRIHEAHKTLGDLPLIVMPAGAAYMFEYNFGVKQTKENLLALMNVCLKAVERRDAAGVVPYRGGLQPGSAPWEALKEAYGDFRRKHGLADHHGTVQEETE